MTTTTSDFNRHAYRKDQHDRQADSYAQYDGMPLGLLEHQLQEAALGDCTGLNILDLGGGQGLRARHAIALGAKAVDVVDLSPEFMRLGQEAEVSAGRGDSIIHWHEGDASRPDELARLPLRGKAPPGYDLVMANWLFDHAASMDVLDGMFRSVIAFLRPGGRLVGTRTFYDPRARAVVATDTHKAVYGVRYKDHMTVPGGMLYRYELPTAKPIPLEFEAASMEVTYKPELVERFHARYGLVDTQVERPEKASCVKEDPEFWRLFLEHPSMAVVSARKKTKEEQQQQQQQQHRHQYQHQQA